MKDKWLKDLHDRMADFEMEAPQGLWDDLKEAASSGNLKSRKKRLGLLPFHSAKRIISIAAAAIIILALGFSLRHRHTHLDSTDYNRPVIAQGEASHTTSGNASISKSIASTSPKATIRPSRLQPAVQSKTPVELADEPDETGIADTTTGLQSETIPVESPQATRTYTPARNEVYPGNYIAQNRSRDNRLSVGISTSGSTSSSESQTTPQNSFVSAIGPDKTQWEDSPMLGILLYNQGQETTTDIRHHLPIRSGVTVAYRLTRRLAIESGVSYTKLISDITDGSESHYYTGEQKLHYVGIPLKLTYTVMSWKSLDIYASAGAIVEKCVSGKEKRAYVLDKQQVRSETERISEKPWQLSANVSTGAQLNLTQDLGVYAEPGVSYYFDDNSGLRTIYKDKPLNFNLNIGLRLTL